MNKKNNILILGAFLVLLLPNIATSVLCTNLNYSIVKELGYWAVVFTFLLLPATFLKTRTYFIVEGIFGVFGAPIEIASLFLNRMTVSSHFMGIIFETNRMEAFELLSSVWPLLIAIVGIWVLYWTMVIKMDNIYIIPPRWRKVVWISLPVLAATGIAVTLFLVPHRANNWKQKVYLATDHVVMKFRKIYPYDIYLATADWRRECTIRRQLEAQVQSFSFGIVPKCDSIEEHYILLIGEAARYDHFHCNGYTRPTSPYLDTIQGLYSLSHCYAEANLTRNALSLMLTRANSKHTNIATQEKCIVEAFQEGGFATAWISNQPMMEFTTRMARTADYCYESITGFDGRGLLDTVVIGKANRWITTQKPIKSFMLLHTLGSHLKYNHRYPEEMAYFMPSLTNSDGYAVLSPKNKTRIINAYDNTIRYTDYVIATAIDLLRQQKGRCALIYISDHGENLFDDERELSVHGSYEGTLYEAHIPCFIWANEAYHKAYPTKTAALKANQNTVVSHDVLFYSTADMADLNTIVDSTKSIFSPHILPADTIRMLTGNGSYYTITSYTIQ